VGKSRISGFTLIELMIVVVVIGILAAISIPNFFSLLDRAKESTVKANMHTVQVALEDFSVQNDGIYPTASTSALADGRTVADLCPIRSYIPSRRSRRWSILVRIRPSATRASSASTRP
jgi:prepilin-type N-terminal cleavage/methylation domain-containing protein